MITRSAWAEDLGEKKPIIKQVNEMYMKKYGVSMNENSARAFMGTLTLFDAINRAGSSQPQAIRDALSKTDIPGDQTILAWDGIKFDETGQNVLGRGIMVQIMQGRYYTVWPFEYASRKM